MKIKTTLFIALTFIGLKSNAQNPGQLDSSFGTAGKVIANPYGYMEIYASAIQTDGKIVSVGRSKNGTDYNFCAMRFNTNGSVDTTFGTNGAFYVDMRGGGYFDSANAVIIQPDGKIIVGGFASINTNAGVCYFGLIRLNPNGTLDSTFGTAGKTSFPVGVASGVEVDNRIYALGLQPDGKILAVGSAYNSSSLDDFAIARLNTDGSLDVDFSNDGKATVDYQGYGEAAIQVKVEPSGKILVAGYVREDFGMVRFYDDGTIDTTYGTSGKILAATTNTFTFGISAVAFQQDGKAVVLGTNGNDVAMCRVNVDGSFDTAFGVSGKVITDIDNSSSDDGSSGLLIQPDGKIIATALCATGGTNYFATLRYTDAGVLDTTFSNDGQILTNMAGGYNSPTSATLQPDGKLVIGGFAGFTGQTGFALARYGTGILETDAFTVNTFKVYPNPTSGVVNIINQNADLAHTPYTLIDQLGKTLINGNLGTNQIDLSGLNAGVYFVKIENSAFKIVKQ